MAIMDIRIRKELTRLEAENKRLNNELMVERCKLQDTRMALVKLINLLSQDEDYSPEDIKDIKYNHNLL